jgi:hypothetical protein
MNDCFQFLRADLQQKLIALVVAMGLEYWIEDGRLCTHERDRFVVEDLRSAIRTSVFEDWHLFRGTSAKNPVLYNRYRAYIIERGIPFVEEEDNGSRWFLLRKVDDPYKWGVEAFANPIDR